MRLLTVFYYVPFISGENLKPWEITLNSELLKKYMGSSSPFSSFEKNALFFESFKKSTGISCNLQGLNKIYGICTPYFAVNKKSTEFAPPISE